MSEHTCATRGHLWGALGKCVMCGDERQMSERSTPDGHDAEGNYDWRNDPLEARRNMSKLIATSPLPIVSMVEFKGRLFVATREAVFERGDDGMFREVLFAPTPPAQDAPHGAQAQWTWDDDGEAPEGAGGAL